MESPSSLCESLGSLTHAYQPLSGAASLWLVWRFLGIERYSSWERIFLICEIHERSESISLHPGIVASLESSKAVRLLPNEIPIALCSQFNPRIS
jgi:hypothetical protein